MVADPQCPFCHAAWARLRQRIVEGKLRVKVVLIGLLTENGIPSKPLAISLLSRAEPGKAWFLGEGSEQGYPIAPPPAANTTAYSDAEKYLAINTAFARTYMKRGTPFFGYVGRDGKLYTAEGPDDLDGFLSAL